MKLYTFIALDKTHMNGMRNQPKMGRARHLRTNRRGDATDAILVFVVAILVILVGVSAASLLSRNRAAPNTDSYNVPLVAGVNETVTVNVGHAGFPAAVFVNSTVPVLLALSEQNCANSGFGICPVVKVGAPLFGTAFNTTVEGNSETYLLLLTFHSTENGSLRASVTWEG